MLTYTHCWYSKAPGQNTRCTARALHFTGQLMLLLHDMAEAEAVQGKQPGVQKGLSIVPLLVSNSLFSYAVFPWLQSSSFTVWLILTYCSKYNITTKPKDFGQNKDSCVLYAVSSAMTVSSWLSVRTKALSDCPGTGEETETGISKFVNNMNLNRWRDDCFHHLK